jgi:lipopolysaccharide assembly protein A
MARQPEPAEPSRRPPVTPKMVAGLLAAVLALVFILQNTQRVTIEFLFFDVRVGMWLGLAIAFGLGTLVGWVAPRFRRR